MFSSTIDYNWRVHIYRTTNINSIVFAFQKPDASLSQIIEVDNNMQKGIN